MFIKSKWSAITAYCIALLIILTVYGAIPFLSVPTLAQVVWASGFAESFVNAGWPSIKAFNFGLPDNAAIAFGLAGAFLQSTFIAIFGMHPADAYAMGAVLWLALSLWGAIRLCQFLGTSFALGSFLSLIYLTLPIVWRHDIFSMLSFGFALLPLYLYLAFRVIYDLPKTRLYSRYWLITVFKFIAVSLLSVFMDGYTFVMFFAACGLIWFVAFIREDVKRKLLVYQSLPVILLSALVSYLLYTLYVGTSEYSPSPMSFFRGWGVDLVMLLIPSQGVAWLWDALGISVPRSSNDFFGDASVWMTTFALPLIIVGVVGYCFARRNRYALPLLLVALIGFYFSLGPSLKVNSVRPVDENGKVLVQGQLMPPEAALIPTGNAIIYEHVPGFNSMRATYRWSGLMFTALWGLSVLFIISMSSTYTGYFISSIIIAFLIISNLPDIPNRLKQGINYHIAMHQMDTDFAPLADYLGKEARVFFAPPGNDFIVNYLAATGNYRAFNIGGDKNLEMARKAWPQPIKQMQLFNPGPYFVEELKIILLDDIADYVVIPYFDMLWGAHAWPPNRNEIITRKEKFSHVVDIFEKDSLFNVKNEKLYAIISLSPDANMQHIQSALREASRIYNCQPPKCLHWEAEHENIPMKVGKQVSNAVRSTGQSGFLVYGPYKTMNAGSYMLELRGMINSTNGRVITDVVGDKGQHTFARFEGVDGVNLGDETVLLNKKVVLDKAVSDLEVRVWVDELVDIELTGYSLIPIDDNENPSLL
ncbi:hypothetical protein [Desulfallas thermosapovorans]|uniref:4-amino-4-deoxy-L-arabinose transferase-like glycosyltransferase n=1 Tax=Desulfallas thermosapovorans DSM 6562 TaxID=1121431 RepID=A0A5S4ZUL3_9FIRM|nr:hypothetical protein [Desulfallas thermosapovorans]TYO96598.1 hypothetical protein LX24_01067 [Desulfallas thermosapovorans DSM 6562]